MDEEMSDNARLHNIHSKAMIVDDQRIIMGLVDLKNRSQMGDRDSEIALVFEDGNLIGLYMDGEPYQTSHLAATPQQNL